MIGCFRSTRGSGCGMVHLVVKQDIARPEKKKSTAVHVTKVKNNIILKEKARLNRDSLMGGVSYPAAILAFAPTYPS